MTITIKIFLVIIAILLISVVAVLIKMKQPIEPEQTLTITDVNVEDGTIKVTLSGVGANGDSKKWPCSFDKGDFGDTWEWLQMSTPVLKYITDNCTKDKRCLLLGNLKSVQIDSCEDFEDKMDTWIIQDKTNLSAKWQTKINNLIAREVLMEEVQIEK